MKAVNIDGSYLTYKGKPLVRKGNEVPQKLQDRIAKLETKAAQPKAEQKTVKKESAHRTSLSYAAVTQLR